MYRRTTMPKSDFNKVAKHLWVAASMTGNFIFLSDWFEQF